MGRLPPQKSNTWIQKMTRCFLAGENVLPVRQYLRTFRTYKNRVVGYQAFLNYFGHNHWLSGSVLLQLFD